jgi:hypothetical protein
LAALGAGCAVTGSDGGGLGARLPTGVTLLESDRGECEGPVTLDDRALDNPRRADLVIQRGQNATFEIDTDDDDVEIEWTCVGSSDTDRDSVECPEETEYVRITRGATGDEFLFECYGERD